MTPSTHPLLDVRGVNKRFGGLQALSDVGLRINPEPAEGEVAKYDPCSPHSRLGFPVSQLKAKHLDGVSGIHFHSLCEQDFEPLQRTWDALEPRIAPYFGRRLTARTASRPSRAPGRRAQ